MNLFQYSIALRITKNNNATAIPNFDNNLIKSFSKNKKIKATTEIIRNSTSKNDDFFDITYAEIYLTTLDAAHKPQIAQTPSQNSLPVTSPS